MVYFILWQIICWKAVEPVLQKRVFWRRGCQHLNAGKMVASKPINNPIPSKSTQLFRASYICTLFTKVDVANFKLLRTREVEFRYFKDVKLPTFTSKDKCLHLCCEIISSRLN